jgi:hypothetical protein
MCLTHLIKLPWEIGVVLIQLPWDKDGVSVPHSTDPTLLGEGWSLCATPT